MLALWAVLGLTACGRFGYDNAGVTDDAGLAGDGATPDAFTIPDNALFISPSGSDNNDGSQDAPFQSFSFALSKLAPGGTLISMPGEYNASSGTGTMDIDCQASSDACDGAPCPNGMADAPIVIRAFEERQARLVAEAGMTSASIGIRGCEHYRVEGFTVIGRDDVDNPWENVAIAQSSNIAFRRNLVSRSNRMVNGHAVLIDRSSDILIEDNEVYDFHREGIAVYISSDITVRRNYLNARSYADLPGGYDSLYPSSGDAALTCSHSADCLFENNISEGNTLDAAEMSTQMSGSDAIPNAGKDARYVGNLFIDAARFGFFLSSNCQVGSFCTDEFIVARPVLRDNLVLRSGEHGINVRGAVEVVIDHNSLIDSSLRIDLSNQNADMLASSAVSNTLAVTAKDFGITVIQQDTWSIDYSSSQGTFPGFETSGETSGLGPNNLDVDAMLGSCVHRIPPTSPLSGAGSGGSDIGATIIKRYVDGNLTNEALWDPTTGAFPCGAIVAGINDSGEVCSSVHTRLGISTSCAVE